MQARHPAAAEGPPPPPLQQQQQQPQQEPGSPRLLHQQRQPAPAAGGGQLGASEQGAEPPLADRQRMEPQHYAIMDAARREVVGMSLADMQQQLAQEGEQPPSLQEARHRLRLARTQVMAQYRQPADQRSTGTMAALWKRAALYERYVAWLEGHPADSPGGPTGPSAAAALRHQGQPPTSSQQQPMQQQQVQPQRPQQELAAANGTQRMGDAAATAAAAAAAAAAGSEASVAATCAAAERSPALEATWREVAGESLAVLRQRLFFDRGKPCLSLPEARKELAQRQAAFARLPPSVHLPDGGELHWKGVARLERYIQLLSSQAQQAAAPGMWAGMQHRVHQAAAVPTPAQPAQPLQQPLSGASMPQVQQQQGPAQQQPVAGAARPPLPTAASAARGEAPSAQHRDSSEGQLPAPAAGHAAPAAAIQAAVGRPPPLVPLSPTPPAVQAAVAPALPRQTPEQPGEQGQAGRKRDAAELPAAELLAPPAKRPAAVPLDGKLRASSPPVENTEAASEVSERQQAAQALLAAALAPGPASNGPAAAALPAAGMASQALPTAPAAAAAAAGTTAAVAEPGPANRNATASASAVQPAAAPGVQGPGASGPTRGALPSSIYVLTDTESDEDDIIDIT